MIIGDVFATYTSHNCAIDAAEYDNRCFVAPCATLLGSQIINTGFYHRKLA